MKIAAYILLVITGFLSPPIQAAELVIEEWVVPWEYSQPRDPYVGPDARIWFVGQRGDYIASLILPLVISGNYHSKKGLVRIT